MALSAQHLISCPAHGLCLKLSANIVITVELSFIMQQLLGKFMKKGLFLHGFPARGQCSHVYQSGFEMSHTVVLFNEIILDGKKGMNSANFTVNIDYFMTSPNQPSFANV